MEARVFTDKAEAQEWAERNFAQWQDSLDWQDAQGFTTFKGEHSGTVNIPLRGGDTGDINMPLHDRLVSLMDSGFNTTGATVSEDITVWRGMRPDALGVNLEGIDATKLVGLEVQDHGYASTSLSRDIAEKTA